MTLYGHSGDPDLSLRARRSRTQDFTVSLAGEHDFQSRCRELPKDDTFRDKDQVAQDNRLELVLTLLVGSSL